MYRKHLLEDGMAISCGFLGATWAASHDRLFAQAPPAAAASDFLCVKNIDPRGCRILAYRGHIPKTKRRPDWPSFDPMLESVARNR